jgi:hypothetical protein
LNTDFGIKNERQDCKTGNTVWQASCRRVNEGNKSEGIQLRASDTYMKQNDKKSCNCLGGVGRKLQGGEGGGNLTNVQYKAFEN